MRAAMFEGEVMRLDVVDDVEIEDPRAGEVLVAISHWGVCHTDLHFLDGTFDGLFPLPIIFGHEASGIVEEVGEGVTAVQPGDLEGMVTKRRPLEEVGEAFQDLRKGVGIREVIALA